MKYCKIAFDFGDSQAIYNSGFGLANVYLGTIDLSVSMKYFKWYVILKIRKQCITMVLEFQKDIFEQFII
jgi:hypothetical protein